MILAGIIILELAILGIVIWWKFFKKWYSMYSNISHISFFYICNKIQLTG